MAIIDFLMGGGAGQAESPLERILRRQRETGFTPGINPNAPGPAETMAQIASQGNFGGPPVQSTVSPRRISATADRQTRGERPIESILGALGGPGRSVRDFISPATNFLGKVADASRNAALSGSLNSLAPNFSAGVQGAAQRQLDESFRNAQLEIARERNRIARETDPNAKRRVTSQTVDSDGNILVTLNDPSSPEGFRIVNTGIKEGSRTQVFNIPGVGAFRHNSITGEIEPLADEPVVQQAIEERAAAQASGTGSGQIDTADIQRAQKAPEVIGTIQENIDRANFFLDALRSGDLNTGLLEQAASTFTGIGQDFRSFTGTNVLNLISQATFGALSEGEREFLRTISFSLAKDEPVNIRDLERYIDLQERMLKSEQAAIGRAQEAAPERFEDPQKALERKGIKVKRSN